jgi:hypothetical protein
MLIRAAIAVDRHEKGRLGLSALYLFICCFTPHSLDEQPGFEVGGPGLLSSGRLQIRCDQSKQRPAASEQQQPNAQEPVARSPVNP